MKLFILFFGLVYSQLICNFNSTLFLCTGSGNYSTLNSGNTVYLIISNSISATINMNNTFINSSIIITSGAITTEIDIFNNIFDPVICNSLSITTMGNDILNINDNNFENYDILIDSNLYTITNFINNTYKTVCNGISINGNGSNIIQKNIFDAQSIPFLNLITIFDQQLSLINNNTFNNIVNFKGTKLYGYIDKINIYDNNIFINDITITITIDEMAFFSVLDHTQYSNNINIYSNNLIFLISCTHYIPFIHVYNLNFGFDYMNIINNNVTTIQYDPFVTSVQMITNVNILSLKQSFISNRLTEQTSIDKSLIWVLIPISNNITITNNIYITQRTSLVYISIDKTTFINLQIDSFIHVQNWNNTVHLELHDNKVLKSGLFDGIIFNQVFEANLKRGILLI